MQRIGALLVMVVCIGGAAVASPSAESGVVVRGAHDAEVRAGLDRTLAALDLHPASGAVDIELRDLAPQVTHYSIRIKRDHGELQRAGVAGPDELVSRVGSVVLLGLLAREPERRPRLGLVVNAERTLAPAAAKEAWRAALQQRGYLLVPDAEVELARSTLKKASEPEAALAELFAVPVIELELRSRGSEVAVQATVFDDRPRRGSFAELPPAEVEPHVTLMLELLDLTARKFR
jgi:hypothetical protein